MEKEIGNLCLKLDPCHHWIACLEDWGRIIYASHYTADFLHHKDTNARINSLKMQWCTNVKKHDIPLPYVKDWIAVCGCLLSQEASGYALPPIVQKPQPIKSWAVVSSRLIERDHMEKELASIMIEHNARLVCAPSTLNANPTSSMAEYKCHQGRKPCCVGTNARRLRK